jgi:transmembrane 9 superfamily protein 2/4
MGRFGALIAAAAVLAPATGFYLPGVAPRAYVKDEPLALLVNRLDSTESIVPYDYYHFDFCELGENPVTGANNPTIGTAVSENLGQILMGERIRHSPYEVRMKEDVQCRALCKRNYTWEEKSTKKNKKKKYKQIFNAIRKDYMHHWIMDNLPVVECTSNCRGGQEYTEGQVIHKFPYYRLGFPVGCAIGPARKSMTVCTVNTIANMYPEEVFINNHVDITVDYHESAEFDGSRIVGATISPRSIHHKSVDNLDCGAGNDPQPFNLTKQRSQLDIIYTYSVIFRPSELKWASRWDSYLQSAESTSIHWFSIVNSLIIVVFLSGMIGVILVRTLHKDIARYNTAEQVEEAQEEFGWKLVHGDVFRPPANSMLLSVLLGTGAQISLMALVTLIFACLGFLSPATRGGLMTAMLVMFVFLGTPAGFVSARMYKMFGGEQWKSNVLMTAFLCPGIVFFVFFILNLILWYKESSAAVPFGTLCALVALWFCISVPLTFLGAYLGFKKPAIEHPVRTNTIPRQIPPQSLYTQFFPGIAMGGILPFGCVFIQLFFILNSIWGHKLYYVFGFLMIVFLILTITVIESTILLCYFHLCAEEYRWWWRAFLTAGSSSGYLFLYALLFYVKRMEVDGTINLILYVGYTASATFLFWLLTGTMGFFGCFAFVRKIYSVVKVD